MTIPATLRLLGIGAALCASGWTGAAEAAATPIAPVTYEMIDGDGYVDSLYSGTEVGGHLSGGLGELTDGGIAADEYSVNPAPYVCWFSQNPTITFDFARVISLASVTSCYEHETPFSGVHTPKEFSFGVVGGPSLIQTVIDQAGDAPQSTTLTFATDLVGQYFDMTIVQGVTGDTSWAMVSEVAFTSASLPLPKGLPLMLAGLGMPGWTGRRRAGA